MNNNGGKITNLMLHDFLYVHFAFIWIERRTNFNVTPDIYLQQFICPSLGSAAYHFLLPFISFECRIHCINLPGKRNSIFIFLNFAILLIDQYIYAITNMEW